MLARATTDEGEVQSHLAESLRHKDLQLMLKRGFDLFGGILLLLALSPIFAATALAILASSPGPIFFRQNREGHRGKQFAMWKFRSMEVAHDSATTEAQRLAANEGKLIKFENDPRVTKVGRFIRAASIDELPQLFNVLKGDMSLVGPRPLVPFMLAPYPKFRETRSLVRPGLTGLWQIRDRENNTSAVSMMPHDLEYISNLSLRLDLMILAQTVRAVVSRKGAC